MKIKAKVLYLPAYSPDFVQIEMWFSIIKRKFNVELRDQHTKFNFKQNYGWVVNVFRKIEPITIKKLFNQMYLEIQRFITIKSFIIK